MRITHIVNLCIHCCLSSSLSSSLLITSSSPQSPLLQIYLSISFSLTHHLSVYHCLRLRCGTSSSFSMLIVYCLLGFSVSLLFSKVINTKMVNLITCQEWFHVCSSGIRLNIFQLATFQRVNCRQVAWKEVGYLLCWETKNYCHYCH